MKHFLQYITNLEALVKRQSAFVTVILLIYMEKSQDTMEALRNSQISTLLLTKFWVFIQF